MRVVAKAAAIIVLTGFFEIRAQDGSSLTDFELQEPGLRSSFSELDFDDFAVLQEKFLLAQATIQALTETASALASESEGTKRELSEAHLRLEALGLSEVGADSSRLEARLLQAIRELRVLKEQNSKASEQLILLSEAIQVFIASASGFHPQARMNVEAELRKTEKTLFSARLAGAQSDNQSLGDALVVGVKNDLSLLVANVGKVHGAKVGMPLQILRNGQQVGNAQIIEVREQISGAVIQNLTSGDENIVEGDTLKVDARK